MANANDSQGPIQDAANGVPDATTKIQVADTTPWPIYRASKGVIEMIGQPVAGQPLGAAVNTQPLPAPAMPGAGPIYRVGKGVIEEIGRPGGGQGMGPALAAQSPPAAVPSVGAGPIYRVGKGVVEDAGRPVSNMAAVALRGGTTSSPIYRTGSPIYRAATGT